MIFEIGDELKTFRRFDKISSCVKTDEPEGFSPILHHFTTTIINHHPPAEVPVRRDLKVSLVPKFNLGTS
ncbi:MAG: hypothetical protein J7L86_04225 [Candidatus Marinimicrobia bacterium]|nr:hypothetical protein [Candidatus Neomarinimicrobiota bacterium]